MHTKFKKDIKSKPERHTFVAKEIISHVRPYNDETDSQHKMFFTKLLKIRLRLLVKRII